MLFRYFLCEFERRGWVNLAEVRAVQLPAPEADLRWGVDRVVLREGRWG